MLTSRDITEVRDISGVAVSPDAQVAAVRVEHPDTSRNAIRLTWYLVPLSDAGELRELVDAGEPLWNEAGLLLTETPRWSGDSKWLYFRMLKDQQVQLWRANRQGGRAEQITAGPENVEQFAIDETGERAFYVVRASRDAIQNAEEREYVEGVVLDGTVQVRDRLTKNFPYRGRMTTIRRDLAHSFFPLLVNTPARVRVVNLATRAAWDASDDEAVRAKRAFGEALPAGFSAIQPSPDRSGFAFIRGLTQDSLGRSRGLSEVRFGKSVDGPSVTCAPELCQGARLSGLEWTKDGREVVFLSQSPSGRMTMHAWNVHLGTIREVLSTDGVLGGDGGLSRAFPQQSCPLARDEAICVTSSAMVPPRIEAVKISTGRRRVLFEPNRELQAKFTAKAEYLTWKDRWGRQATGVLVMPRALPESTRIPLVVTSYRCAGFLRGGSGSTVSEHLLVARGIAALCVNYDGAIANSPYPSSEIGLGQHRRVQTILDSWESGIDAAQQRYAVFDSDKIGVSGHSLSSEATLYAIGHSSRFAAAASSGAGYQDPMNYYNIALMGELGRYLLDDVYLLPHPDRDPKGIYQKVSAALNSHRIKAPLLIQACEAEFRSGIQFFASMVEQKKTVEFIVFPDEGHHFMQPRHRMVANERNADWFQFWLGAPSAVPDADSPQYVRWRKLRQMRQRP